MDSEDIEHRDHEALKSPFSRMYLCQESEQIINCTMGLKYPIDVDALKLAFSNSIMVKHPRFCSLMVRDGNGADCWRRTPVNLDDHIIIHHPTTAKNLANEDGGEEAVNDYLADIAVLTPLSRNKPMWELHVLMGLKCVVLRVHHALGDGVSLMSMLSACFAKKCDGNDVKVSHANKRAWKDRSVWGLIKSIWFTIVFGLRLLGRVLWVKDKHSVISGGDGVELWPRKLVSVKFKLDDFKFIKKAIPNSTVNDVLLGVISSGLSKYLQVISPKEMLQGLQLSGIVVVNLRKHPGFQEMSEPMETSSWGNKTGLVVLPIHCCNGLQALEHMRIMKATMDRKKLSYEAHLPYIALKLLTSCFGPKVASWCSHKVLCNTSFLMSNIMGPSEEMVIGGNPVTYLRVNVSGLPHAITTHMVSYGENADLQIMVAKDIIHDPQFLANCFQQSLDEMKKVCADQNQKMNCLKLSTV